MLSSLQIENVAVIQKAEVHFEPGLNVLTGETGAGKSILIDSINAILGNRTSKDLVRTGAAKAVIRAAFEQVPPAVLDKLEQSGYEQLPHQRNAGYGSRSAGAVRRSDQHQRPARFGGSAQPGASSGHFGRLCAKPHCFSGVLCPVPGAGAGQAGAGCPDH